MRSSCVLFSLLSIGLVACSSAPKPGQGSSPAAEPSTEELGGETFCLSYEENFITTCRQSCEGQYELWQQEEIAACSPGCLANLAADETFNAKCPEDATDARARAAASPPAAEPEATASPPEIAPEEAASPPETAPEAD